eukprot:CAMPEP_0204827264 /NCGR_PEP_ID=MMETSP1346-20131115/4767_1 /ASSEMBLY_ACC=CAM_ASM_000771 /TAXON_ID=215587 /ORGANISM="Aplanochytrium stocchinoi, Strain GSBS06" /LENGTH=320 /DNA_ID=CAMNT_0051955619 /DNA_START=308 /DNA_END=1267 /DNA_ORIENTATION=-
MHCQLAVEHRVCVFDRTSSVVKRGLDLIIPAYQMAANSNDVHLQHRRVSAIPVQEQFSDVSQKDEYLLHVAQNMPEISKLHPQNQNVFIPEPLDTARDQWPENQTTHDLPLINGYNPCSKVNRTLTISKSRQGNIMSHGNIPHTNNSSGGFQANRANTRDEISSGRASTSTFVKHERKFAASSSSRKRRKSVMSIDENEEVTSWSHDDDHHFETNGADTNVNEMKLSSNNYGKILKKNKNVIERSSSWSRATKRAKRKTNVNESKAKLKRSASWNPKTSKGGGGRRYSVLDHVQLIGAVCNDHEDEGGIYANYERNQVAW